MKERILDYMQQHDFITTVDAFTKLNCTRLSEYIRQLKETHIIQSEWIIATNQHGEKVRYKKYWLAD